MVLFGPKSIGSTFTSDFIHQLVKNELESRMLKYEIARTALEKDRILTRTMQLYLDNKNSIPTNLKPFYNVIYKDMVKLRKFLFKRDWKNHSQAINSLRLKILLS